VVNIFFQKRSLTQYDQQSDIIKGNVFVNRDFVVFFHAIFLCINSFKIKNASNHQTYYMD